ncbi:uncharacterized protein V6R79_021054 [Siganus canaliculatus]
MEEEERLRSLMFLVTYILLKRRRDISNADVQRRNEIQRRIRHRQYFFQRQRRMLMVSPITLLFAVTLAYIPVDVTSKTRTAMSILKLSN